MLDDLAATCSAVSQLNAKYRELGKEPDAGADVDAILSALNEFMECVRYLNTRRSESAILTLDSEAAVQDALYLMLRPWIHDLIPEDPTGKVANRYTIKDFFSKSAETVIEAKFIRDAAHGRSISKEIHDDIETYRHHLGCRHLVFFIFDQDALIPDQRALIEQIETERTYGGVALQCHAVVKP